MDDGGYAIMREQQWSFQSAPVWFSRKTCGVCDVNLGTSDSGQTHAPSFPQSTKWIKCTHTTDGRCCLTHRSETS